MPQPFKDYNEQYSYDENYDYDGEYEGDDEAGLNDSADENVIKVEPKFTSVGSSITVDEGKTINLPCYVDKLPGESKFYCPQRLFPLRFRSEIREFYRPLISKMEIYRIK